MVVRTENLREAPFVEWNHGVTVNESRAGVSFSRTVNCAGSSSIIATPRISIVDIIASAPDDLVEAPPAGDASGPYRLGSRLDLTAARDLQQDLRSRLAAGAVVLDAQDVERMSTPCLQVVLAAGRAATAANVPFRIVGTSETFSAAVVELGLKSQFSIWME